MLADSACMTAQGAAAYCSWLLWESVCCHGFGEGDDAVCNDSTSNRVLEIEFDCSVKRLVVGVFKERGSRAVKPADTAALHNHTNMCVLECVQAGQAQWQECLASAAILSTSDSTANTQAAKPTSAAGIGSNHTPVYDEVDLDVFQTAEGHQQEQEEDPYTDKRWRQITLQPYGRRWQDRIDELRQHWRAHHQSVPQQQVPS